MLLCIHTLWVFLLLLLSHVPVRLSVARRRLWRRLLVSGAAKLRFVCVAFSRSWSTRPRGAAERVDPGSSFPSPPLRLCLAFPRERAARWREWRRLVHIATSPPTPSFYSHHRHLLPAPVFPISAHSRRIMPAGTTVLSTLQAP